MGEFQEAHTVSRLIGSHRGFGEGGVLTEMGSGEMSSTVRLGVEQGGNFSFSFDDGGKVEKAKRKRMK